MKRKYNSYLYVIAYLMLLRVVLNITIGLDAFNLGFLFDLVLMMFWVGIFSALLKRRVSQKIWYIIVIVVATVFTIGDSMYYDYFSIISARSSFSGLSLLTQGQTLEEYHLTIPLVGWLVAPILILTIYLIISNKKKDVFYMRDFGILSLVFLVQVGLFLFWGSYEFDSRVDYYRSDAYLFETMHDRVKFSEKYGYYNYHILDFTRIRTKPDYDEYEKEIDAYFENVIHHETNEYSDMYEGYNVVTILVESLDTRFIDETLTPNLYMMRENGMSFDNYFVPVFQQGATCNSEYMSLTGLQAITTNDWSNNVCDSYSENSFPYALPQQLNEIGYNTYYFHSGYEWFYNRNVMIPSYGFETIKFQEDIFKQVEEDHNLDCDIMSDDREICNTYFQERYDRDMMQFVEGYVSFDQPFHLNLLTYSGHGAYNQEDFDKYLDIVNDSLDDPDSVDYEIKNYMEKIVEFDMLLGDLMTYLEENNELDNTLFAIYPDHYPYMLNTDTYQDHLELDIYDKEVHRQDLIIYASDMEKQVISNPGSTVDITPTLLNLLHSDGTFDYFMGTDLLSNTDNYVIFSDLAVTNGNTTLLIDNTYVGDTINTSTWDAILEDEIIHLEIQRKILLTDYFKEEE